VLGVMARQLASTDVALVRALFKVGGASTDQRSNGAQPFGFFVVLCNLGFVLAY